MFAKRKNYNPFKHTRHNSSQSVGIRVTTHPFQRADPRTRPSVGTFLRKVPMCRVHTRSHYCQLPYYLAFHLKRDWRIEILSYERPFGIQRRNWYILSRSESFCFCNTLLTLNPVNYAHRCRIANVDGSGRLWMSYCWTVKANKGDLTN